MKFTADVAHRCFVGTSNQTSKLHFHGYFKQRPIIFNRRIPNLFLITILPKIRPGPTP